MSAHFCRSFSIPQKTTTTKSDLQLAKYSSILRFLHWKVKYDIWKQKKNKITTLTCRNFTHIKNNNTFLYCCNIWLICVFFNRQHSVQITNSRRRLGLNLKPKPGFGFKAFETKAWLFIVSSTSECKQEQLWTRVSCCDRDVKDSGVSWHHWLKCVSEGAWERVCPCVCVSVPLKP